MQSSSSYMAGREGGEGGEPAEGWRDAWMGCMTTNSISAQSALEALDWRKTTSS